MGATQFRLLTTLGLREHHKLLDFGCGSLRAGRLFLPYLLPGNYYGIDPTTWLIEDAIRHEIGEEQIRLKRPSFSHNADFRVDGFGVIFDFIVAQSIFSHAGPDLIDTALKSFRACLADSGLILATFIQVGSPGTPNEYNGKGWVYPECVGYRPDTIARFLEDAGLVGVSLPWYHPRQQWYAIARVRSTLPQLAKFCHLSGAVLRDRELANSS
jgi:cyclopropane fatty-acyl-phospholipid synthase-like methyltransferase